MNYLAHLYLSGSDTQILIGNFIGDAVKGSDVQHFSPDVQKGIALHRFIDTYTDNHETVGDAKGLIRHEFGKYTPVVVDVYFDYFLANSWHNHSIEDLSDFALNTYELLNKHHETLPYKAQRFLYYMERNNVLMAYKTMQGMGMVFRGMSQRTPFPSRMELAESILPQYEEAFRGYFNDFFEDLKDQVTSKFDVDL